MSFIKKLVNQLKKFPNPIILLDNKSSYMPLFDYYKEIKKELKDKIEIRLLKKNYGHYVYLKINLPKVFILTDSDIEINKNMPSNFAEILLELSNKYKVYKVGVALNLEDKDEFIKCEKKGNPLYNYQLRFWKDKIPDKYILYKASVDTTFCLVNSKYRVPGIRPVDPAIRIAGDFTARHLPWYKYTLKNIPNDEFNIYINDNKSSTLLRGCILPIIKAKGKDPDKIDISDQNNIFS